PRSCSYLLPSNWPAPRDLLVTDPRTDRPLQDVGIPVFAPVDMGHHELPQIDRVFHDREGPPVSALESLNTTPMPPSLTERPYRRGPRASVRHTASCS